MSVRSALGAAASSFYRQSWRLAFLNALLGVLIVAVAVVVLTTRSGVVLAVLLGPFAAALMHCAVTLAATEELRLTEAVTGLRRYWRRGLLLAALLVVAFFVGLFAVPFYVHAGTWAWPLALLSAYLLAMFVVYQLALWPLAVAGDQVPFQDAVLTAAKLVLRRPLGFAALGAALLLVNVLAIAAAVLPFLTLTIAFSFLAAAHFALPENPAPEV
jgi:hypothetical protein